jgi:predicted O-linked N-acetylglucosamine transferase (SPINDLY family)
MTAFDDLLALGLRHHRAGDLDRAEQLYRAVLDGQPQYAGAWNLLGLVACQRGRHDRALEHIGHALRLRPDDPGFLLNLGVALQGLGRTAETADAFGRAVAARADFAEARNNLANALHTLGRAEEALGHWREAVALRPDYADAHRNLAVALLGQDRPDLALGHARDAARLQPNSAAALLALGDALTGLDRHTEAVDAYRAAAGLRPADADIRRRLARSLRLSGRPDEALAEAREALRLRPEDADAHNETAAALGTLGRAGEAEAHARQALLLRPGDPEASHNLAVLLAARRRFAEAAALLREVLGRRPELTESALALARALLRQGLLDKAEDTLRRALARRPEHGPTHAALGEVLADQGLLAEAQDSFRQALRPEPGLASAHSSLLIALCLDPRTTPDELLAESRRWEECHARVEVQGPDPQHDRDPDRPLRVGYVSGDLVNHVVVKFFGPVLAHHDPRRVQACCYADLLAPDAVTEKLRGLSAGWRVIHGRSDEEVARQVRQDRIDVLVDLAGHTGNRLGVFARRPAPVQLSWLGYPATTGLEAIQYRLTDAAADPPGEAAGDVEELVRLPGCFCVFLPSADAPPVAAAPCLTRGFVTFGSTHKLAKLNDAVLDVWCQVVRSVPGSRLLVYRDTLRGRAAARLWERLAARGLGADRVELACEAAGGNHLGVYAEIDILLDAWPWGGHATACEALWQGVPVLTLRDDRHAGRMVASVLQCVGLGDLVADTPEEFVAKAAGLASATSRLAAVREGLRERVQRSALCDAAGFTRGLEAAYRDLWRRRTQAAGQG